MLAAILIIGELAVGGGEAHQVCQIGSAVGTYNITTPGNLVNAPGGGFLAGGSMFEDAIDYTSESGSITIEPLTGPQDFGSGQGVRGGYGQLMGGYDEANWTVYAVQNQTSYTAGGEPCTQQYVADFVSWGNLPGPLWINLASNTSTLEDPTSENVSCPIGANAHPCGWISFDIGTPTAAEGNGSTLNLCGWTTAFTQEVRGAVGIPLTLHVPYDGRELSVHAAVQWESWDTVWPTASYSFAPGYVWHVFTVGTFSEPTPGILPSGLLGFFTSAC